MIYSFGNRTAWHGSLERYFLLEDLLVAVNPELARQEGTGTMFFDYFLVGESYRQSALDALEEILGDSGGNAEIEADVLVLSEVFRRGPVVMG